MKTYEMTANGEELVRAMARVVRDISDFYPRWDDGTKRIFRDEMHHIAREFAPPHFVPAHLMAALDNICAAYREMDEAEADIDAGLDEFDEPEDERT